MPKGKMRKYDAPDPTRRYNRKLAHVRRSLGLLSTRVQGTTVKGRRHATEDDVTRKRRKEGMLKEWQEAAMIRRTQATASKK
jgi:hypothetical protein